MREFVNDHRTVLQVGAMGMGAFSIIFGRQLLGHFKQVTPFYRLLLAAIPTALYYALLASIMDTVSAHFFSQVTGQALAVHLTPLAFAAVLAAVFASVSVAATTLAGWSTSRRATASRSWSDRAGPLIVSWASFVLYVGFANWYVFTIQH
jgi:hypothetical protein